MCLNWLLFILSLLLSILLESSFLILYFLNTIKFPNVRDHSMKWIWHDSPEINMFRGNYDSWMKEPCSSCDEKEKDFGGCRCQAFLLTGNAANADPVCAKSPQHHLITDSIAEAANPNRVHKPIVFRKKGAITIDFNDFVDSVE